mgnify:CR=1 FL=1
MLSPKFQDDCLTASYRTSVDFEIFKVFSVSETLGHLYHGSEKIKDFFFEIFLIFLKKHQKEVAFYIFVFWKSNIFLKIKIFEIFEKSKFPRFSKNVGFSKKIETRKKLSVEKIFLNFFFWTFFFVFVNYVNIAFQQAIGHYLTPFSRGERAIWMSRPLKIDDFYLVNPIGFSWSPGTFGPRISKKISDLSGFGNRAST